MMFTSILVSSSKERYAGDYTLTISIKTEDLHWLYEVRVCALSKEYYDNQSFEKVISHNFYQTKPK
ncbi:hypothetical protein QJS10_CPA02g00780 [Acorus calamus]|uniref:Uncharacterized protein n=1 Tax=Acorus calamus TaxID=4465 RepID=A0AAV9FEN8_ACOCL|nr:hypothetical protein QJS10_CPA02g00780 [Acorus calamus]